MGLVGTVKPLPGQSTCSGPLFPTVEQVLGSYLVNRVRTFSPLIKLGVRNPRKKESKGVCFVFFGSRVFGEFSWWVSDGGYPRPNNVRVT